MSVQDLYTDLADAKARINELEYHLANVKVESANEDLIQDLKKQLQKAREFQVMAEAAIESLNGR
jgi:predicted  nucleic acid-binding Zn-ribbon protein